MDLLSIQENITLKWMSADLVSIGSGNGLAPPCNRPLPEPMLTKTYTCRHVALLGNNDLIDWFIIIVSNNHYFVFEKTAALF